MVNIQAWIDCEAAVERGRWGAALQEFLDIPCRERPRTAAAAAGPSPGKPARRELRRCRPARLGTLARGVRSLSGLEHPRCRQADNEPLCC